jgi:hypothetical protein
MTEDGGNKYFHNTVQKNPEIKKSLEKMACIYEVSTGLSAYMTVGGSRR